jgi:uncharacterized repeat protein (TIGR01451 family)
MLSRTTMFRLSLLPMALLLSLAAISWQGLAQQQQEQQQPQRKQETVEITLPPDRELLRMRVVAPAEVRVNESFEGEIVVHNLSERFVFHNVKIGTLADSKVTIESSKIGETRSANSQGKQESSDSQQGQKQNQKQDQKAAQQKEQQQQQQEEQKQQQQNQQQQQNEMFGQIWTIDRLDPGQMRTIHFTASSDEQGDMKTCLALVSMTPSLCLHTQFVKPQLEIVKQGPDQANSCEPIVYQYSVKNSGTGEIDSFVIHDKLADGLKTLEGEQELRFQVDGLRAGDVRKFQAKLVPSKAGEFTSRATAKAASGEQARSNSVTTRVVEPNLALAIDGPDAVYVDRPATYTLRVTNHGEGRAAAANVELRFPQSLSIASVSEPWDSERSVEQNQSQSQQQQPTQAQDVQDEAKSDSDPKLSQQKNRKSESSGASRDEAVWELGALAAGETQAMRVTLNTHRGQAAQLEAVAIAWCGEGEAARQIAKVTKSLRTEIISLPALAIAVVDLEDPVQTDKQVTYRVTVRNEGTSADENVRVRIELPSELKFVKATGETEAKADGNQVSFQPVKQLGAGEEVSWRIETQAAKEGKIALRATLESKGLGRTVRAEEPTTLFTASAQSDAAKE